jgi:GMP synthase-like glutamine amidotransferase
LSAQAIHKYLSREKTLNRMPEIRIRVAVLDMNNGARNIAVRNIKRILSDFGYRIRTYHPHTELQVRIFHVRDRSEVPDTSHDLYISTGGPGSPLDDTGAEWEVRFFRLVDDLMAHNQTRDAKKFFFGICHSFQLMVKKFAVARISRRTVRNLGIVPIFQTPEGRRDPIFEGLQEKFYAFDNRDWQVTDPDRRLLREAGIEILSYEGTEEGAGDALTGLRYTDEIETVQFHPEAEKSGILMRITEPKEREHIVEVMGEEKYEELVRSIENPNKLMRTYKTVLPGFLLRSYNRLMAQHDQPTIDPSVLGFPQGGADNFHN